IEEELWKREAAIAAASNLAPGPVTVLELMRIAIIDGEADRATELLSILPISLAQFFGGLNVTSQSLEALSPLDSHFDRLISACVNRNMQTSSVQIIADIRRNAHARAVQLRRNLAGPGQNVSPAYGRPEECTRYVGEGLQPFLTLELVKADHRSFFICTLIE